MSLGAKTIIVTGAASGIGKETTAELQRQGATVVGVDRNPAPGADAFVRADLSDRAQIDAAVDELPSGADGLANIAGLPPTAPAEMVLKVNLRGLQLLTEALVPTLADGASIVNLASLSGIGWANSVDQIEEFDAVGWDGIAAFADRHGNTRVDAATSSPRRRSWCGRCGTAGGGATAASG